MIFKNVSRILVIVCFLVVPHWGLASTAQVYAIIYNGGQTQYVGIIPMRGESYFAFVEPDSTDFGYTISNNAPFMLQPNGGIEQQPLTKLFSMPSYEPIDSFIAKNFKVHDPVQGTVHDITVSNVVPMRTESLVHRNSGQRPKHPADLKDQEFALLSFNKDRARPLSADREGLAFSIPDSRDPRDGINFEVSMQWDEQDYWDRKIREKKTEIITLGGQRQFRLAPMETADPKLIALHGELSVLEKKRAVLGPPMQDLYDIKKFPITLDSAGMPIHRPAETLLLAKDVSAHRIYYTPVGGRPESFDMIAYARRDGGFFYHRVSYDAQGSVVLADTPAPLALKGNADDRYTLYRFSSATSTTLQSSHASIEGVVAYTPTKNRDDFFAYDLFDSTLTDGTPVVYRQSISMPLARTPAQKQSLVNTLNIRMTTHQLQQQRLEAQSTAYKAVLAQDPVFSAKKGVSINRNHIPAYTPTTPLQKQRGLLYTVGADTILVLPPYDPVQKRSIAYKVRADKTLVLNSPIAIDARNPKTIMNSFSSQLTVAPNAKNIRGVQTALSSFDTTTLLEAQVIQRNLAGLSGTKSPLVVTPTAFTMPLKPVSIPQQRPLLTSPAPSIIQTSAPMDPALVVTPSVLHARPQPAPRALPSCFSSASSLSASLVATGGACVRTTKSPHVVDASAMTAIATTASVVKTDSTKDTANTTSSAKSKKPKGNIAKGVGKKKALLGGSVVAAIVGVILLSVGIGVGVSKSSSSKTDSSTNPDDGKQPITCWCVDDQGQSYQCQPIADGVCPAAITASVFSRREEEASSETIRRRHQYGLGMDTLSSYNANTGNTSYFSNTGQTIIAGQSNTIGLSGGSVLKVETGVHHTLNRNNSSNDSYYVALGHKQPLTATTGVLTKMVHSADDGISDTAVHAFGYKSLGQFNLYGGASLTTEDTMQDTWGVIGAEYATKLRTHHTLSVSGQLAYRLSEVDTYSNPTLGTLGVSYGYAPSVNTSLSLMGAVDTDGYTHLKAIARLAF